MSEPKESTDYNQTELNNAIKNLKNQINPQNDPKINGYFESSLEYLNGIYDKMANSKDQDKTAQEISEDLVGKLTNWGAELKKDIDKNEVNIRNDHVGASGDGTSGDAERKNVN